MRNAAILLGGLLAVASSVACKHASQRPNLAEFQPLSGVDRAKVETQVAAFCGDCHAAPRADSFPRESWRREVERGFRFYFDAGRHDLMVPPVEAVIGYYEALAPERLIVRRENGAGNGPVRFRQGESTRPSLEPPAISFVGWMSVPNQRGDALLFSDMRSGRVGMVSPGGGSALTLTTLKNPSRVALGDLDGDGQQEVLIGELGSFTSEDHRRGAVVWLRWDVAAGQWRQRLLVSGLGRVADVRTGDFDDDGDEDLAVAEFGHLRTGRVLVYENLGMEGGNLKLREHVVDDRHGAIHVPAADLDGDGRLDFVALISQEHEVVEAYLNRGDFQFERRRIFAVNDPAHGSSGIELVDLDGDGDLDVLYINGDTFGSDCLKPYHGVSWLENRGDFPFTEHRLASMVGVQAATTADLDGDGDLDIVAAAFLPPNLVASPEVTNYDSLLWLEQVQPGKFALHSLEKGKFLHAALTAADFDADGDIDLAVGNFQDSESEHEPWFWTWWNEARDE